MNLESEMSIVWQGSYSREWMNFNFDQVICSSGCSTATDSICAYRSTKYQSFWWHACESQIHLRPSRMHEQDHQSLSRQWVSLTSCATIKIIFSPCMTKSEVFVLQRSLFKVGAHFGLVPGTTWTRLWRYTLGQLLSTTIKELGKWLRVSSEAERGWNGATLVTSMVQWITIRH